MPKIGAPIKLRIPGTPIPASVPEVPADIRGQITIRSVQAFQISAARAGTTETPVIETLTDDIVEVELEDGVRFWTTQERLWTEVLALAGTRSADGVVELPATFERRSPTRGLVGKVAIKVLKFFRVDVAETAARFIAGKLEECLLGNGEAGRGPGLYRFLPGDELKLIPVSEAALPLPADRWRP
jgi:hypothetical protein